MLRSTKLMHLLLIAAALALIAALACSSDEEDEPAAAPAPAPAAAPAPAPAAAPAPAPAPVAITPGICFSIGEQLTSCPPISPHTYRPATVQVGEFPTYLYSGPRPTEFFESPKSFTLVKTGLLPPLDERLPTPDDVLVVNVAEGIGVYGGTYHIASPRMELGPLNRGHWAKRDANEEYYIPEVGKSFEVSSDGRTWTMQLRRDAKWSDGEPFTIEDIRFAWVDINLNTDINPLVDAAYRDAITGNTVKFEVIDDQTWSLTYDSPNFTLFDGKLGRGMTCSGRRGFCWFAPKHYLSQFHLTYTDEATLKKRADALAVQTWVDVWWAKAQVDLENAQGPSSDLPSNGVPDGLPCMGAWCMKGTHTDVAGTLTRNYFFVGVDPEGNQLPYADELTMDRFESRDVAVFRSLNGETDAYTTSFKLQEMPLYISSMVKGDYSLEHWPATGGNDAALNLNQTWNEDPEIGMWLRTTDFRRALSLATDRNAINDAVFLGLGTPQAWVPHPSTVYYPGDQYAKLDIGYDPAKANQILDSLGLTKKDAQGFRLRSDGQGRLSFTADTNPDEGVDVLEFMKQQWADVGIELSYRAIVSAHVPIRKNEAYMMLSIDHSAYQQNPWAVTWNRLAPLTSSVHMAPLIGKWYETKGVEGMAPGPDSSFLPLAPPGTYPADPTGLLQKLQELWDEGRGYPINSPERIRVGKEIFKIHAEQKFDIPTVAYTGSRRGVMLHRNNFRNVPETHIRDQFGFWRETYYFEDGKDNANHPGYRSTQYTSTSFLNR